MAPEPTDTPEPTAVSQSTATPKPMAAPEATATSAPEPTVSTPEETEEPTMAPVSQQPAAVSGQIAPLMLDDPVAVASELSEGELACLAGIAETDRLLQIFSNPDIASREEQAQFINCLEDESITRLFVTGLIGQSGPLSVETSDCVRSGMDGVDLRSVMLAGSGGDEEAAMVGSMTAFFLTLSCLNEEEFAAAAPALDMTPEDRESLQCVQEQLGGAEGMAATLGSGDESGIMALFGAAIGCGLSLDSGPEPGG